MSMRMAKTIIEQKSYVTEFEQVHRADPVDTCYGMYVYRITDKDIEALKQGKCLYADEMEYAVLVYYEEG